MINIKEDESMKVVMRRIVSILTVIAVMTGTGLLTGCAVTAVVNDNAGPAYNVEASGVIDGWKPDSPAMLSIVEFVRNSVDETSDAYIPVEDRIAVFDMDGTLYGERFPTYFNDWLYIQRALYDEGYEAPAELKEFAKAWEDKVLKGIPIEDFDAKERELGPKLYEGLSSEEYYEVVRKFKQKPVWGFEGMNYGDAFFSPMVSLVEYLCENDYSVYIVSATYRDAVRVMTEGVLDEYVPADRVIGTDLLYVASGDTDRDSMFYELKPEDELVIGGKLFLKNQKTNKAAMIQQEIGRMPVLAFGNSTGDFSMATYTLQNKKYGGRAYMLLCDDTLRDYGDPDVAEAFKKKCDENGFYTVSMKDEFASFYPGGAQMLKEGQDAAVTDYSARENWAYYAEGENRAADLFIICPTVDTRDEYNMSLDDQKTKGNFIGALNMERGIYEESTRMFAPYYRQAAMKVYDLEAAEREPYMEMAYSDISAAFEYYLENENNGRPIILAGFSQGADMCYRLLKDYFGDDKLYDQLIAVYAIGWPCTRELVDKYPQIKPAQSAEDIGVTVSFDCEAPEVEETTIYPAGTEAYVINPLNWKTDSTRADKSENLGACFTDYSGGIKTEEAGLCGCYIDEDRGIVKVTDIKAEDYPAILPILPEGAYHIYDYQFFYRNLQENVKLRVERYFTANP